MKRARTKAQAIQAIEEIVKGVIKDLSGKGRLSEEEISGAWRAAAGVRGAKHTRPVSIKRAVLTVNVDSSGWLYELTVKKRELLGRLEGKIRGKQLRGLRFRIGEIEKKK